MEKIKVQIVEDKLLIAEDIAARLRNNSLEVTGICDTGEEAIRLARANRPDLILMDIELAGPMDGIATAQAIREKDAIPIIYLTDYIDSSTVDRAKKTFPANYLSKPFNEVDLLRAIDLAFSNAMAAPKTDTPKRFIFLRTESQKYLKISFEEILYLQAERAYGKIVTDAGEHVLSTSLNHISEQLNHPDFMRVHRSFVVNLARITSLDGNVIKLGNREVQMSKEYRDGLLSVLNIVK